MKKILTHYSRDIKAEVTVNPQWVLSAKNILEDKPTEVPARSYQVISNIQNFNYMTVLGVQQHELLGIIEKVELATHAYMELLYSNRAIESILNKMEYK